MGKKNQTNPLFSSVLEAHATFLRMQITVYFENLCYEITAF